MEKKANKTTKSQPRKPKFMAYTNREADRKRAIGRIGVANNYGVTCITVWISQRF